jgi:hypothetical protein
MVSMLCGPVLLAGQLATANMPNDFDDKDRYLNADPVTVPSIASSSHNPADWLQAVTGSPLTYQAQERGSGQRHHLSATLSDPPPTVFRLLDRAGRPLMARR